MAEARWHHNSVTPLSEPSIRRLHRRAIAARGEVRALLQRACDKKTEIKNGVDRRNSTRTARISWVGEETLRLRAENISPGSSQLYFSFELGGTGYFFACTTANQPSAGEIVARLPDAIYEAERRDLRRQSVTASGLGPTQVELQAHNAATSTIARVHDRSYDGLGVSAPVDRSLEPGADVVVHFLDGDDVGEKAYATIRHKSVQGADEGWARLGLSMSKAPTGRRIQVEAREAILGDGISARAWRRLVLAGAQVQVAPRRLAKRLRPSRSSAGPQVVEYNNKQGQRIVGLLEQSSLVGEGTAVLIPPSWGRTKETFLPLSATILKMFEGAEEPVSVLRFDGTNRRGESFVDPKARASGEEYLRFRFSQAVEDIHSSVDFLRTHVGARKVVLVTFSLASVEGRRAVATDASGLLAGWVSVVGMVDLQSGLRSVSGGVDYAYGLLEGVSFGRHELVGVLSDMDFTGGDALEHGLVFLEDARRDMARIRIPICWLHGRHDAWMDLDRVVTLMSSGDPSARRLVEIPTGHELRSSREAIETFQLIGREIGRIALGRELKPALPSLVDINRKREAERARLPRKDFRAQAFWRDYVLGRDGNGGIRLLTATDAYKSLMTTQVELLTLKKGDRVLDVGSGTGEFANLVSGLRPPLALHLVEMDLVTEALGRTPWASSPDCARVSKVAADLDLSGGSLPLREGSVDRVLASLVISYLKSPSRALSEIARVLRPGGVLVASSLRRDADISKIYAAGIAELQADRISALLGPGVAAEFETLQREFLNSASRLLDLEESGRFRFFDPEELVDLFEASGFEQIAVRRAFGDPPQAVIVAGRRR